MVIVDYWNNSTADYQTNFEIVLVLNPTKLIFLIDDSIF
jgi:hypothetical protein